MLANPFNCPVHWPWPARVPLFSLRLKELGSPCRPCEVRNSIYRYRKIHIYHWSKWFYRFILTISIIYGNNTHDGETYEYKIYEHDSLQATGRRLPARLVMWLLVAVRWMIAKVLLLVGMAWLWHHGYGRRVLRCLLFPHWRVHSTRQWEMGGRFGKLLCHSVASWVSS